MPMHVSSNNVSVSVNRESTPGVASTLWKELQVNGKPDITAKLTKVKRTPIEKERNARKGAAVKLDAAAKLEMDLTHEVMREITEASYMAVAYGPLQWVGANRPTATTSAHFTVPNIGSALVAGTLVVSRGWKTAANNGVFVVGSMSTTTTVIVTGLVAETPDTNQNVSLEVCGVQGASADITIAANQVLATLLDLTTLGLQPGQRVWVGGPTSGTSFDTAACRGLGRVVSVVAGVITTDRTTTTWATDAGTGKTIWLLFGPFIRNVPVTSGAPWLRRPYDIETAFPDLGGSGTDGYIYGEGQEIDETTIDMPLTNKATVSLAFVGMNTTSPTTSRKSGASVALPASPQELMNTSSQVLDISLTALDGTDVASGFQSVKVTIKNNLKAQNQMGTLGAAFVNVGRQDVSCDVQAFFDNSAVLAAVRTETSMAFGVGLRSDDLAGFYFDVPVCTLDGGDLDYPENETVLETVTVLPYKDPILGYQSSITIFPYMPAA